MLPYERFKVVNDPTKDIRVVPVDVGTLRPMHVFVLLKAVVDRQYGAGNGVKV